MLDAFPAGSMDEAVDFWLELCRACEAGQKGFAPEASAEACEGLVGAPVEEVKGEAALDSEALDPERDLNDDARPALVSVPSTAAAELERKLKRIEAVSLGARLRLKGGHASQGSEDPAAGEQQLLYIRGQLLPRRRAEQCSTAIIERRPPTSGTGGAAGSASEELSDFSVVPAPYSFVKDWRGSEKERHFEESFDILSVVCDAVEEKARSSQMFPSARFASKLVGQVIEAQEDDEWHMATLLGPSQEAGKSIGQNAFIRVQWSWNGKISEVPANSIRRACSLALFGPPMQRLKAELALLERMEDIAQGIGIVHASALTAPRGLGIEAPEEARIGWNFKRKLTENDEGSMLLMLLQVTGCVSITFANQPRPMSTAWRDNQPYRAVIAGTQEQRWFASNLLKFLTTIHDRNRSDPPITIPPPPHLGGECSSVNVPQDTMGAMIGKWGSTWNQLQQETGCLLVQYRSLQGEGKRQATEDDDLLEVMMDHVRKGNNQEILIFGPPRGVLFAKMKLLAIVETKYAGYFARPTVPDDEPCEELDPIKGLGTDKVWLDVDFEADTNRTRAVALGAAAQCLVESAGKLVFFMGTKEERRRGREYLPWLHKWSSVKALTKKLPFVLGALKRRDMLVLKPISKQIWSSKWMKDRMVKLGEKSGVYAFFDNCWPEGPERSASAVFLNEDDAGIDTEERRMVIVGAELEKQGRRSEFAMGVLRDVLQLLSDAEDWDKDGGISWKKKEMEKKDQNRREQEDKKRSQGHQQDSGMSLTQPGASEPPGPAAPLPLLFSPGCAPPVPATPAFAPALPATPGAARFFQGLGVPPPQTPMPGIALPATPGAGPRIIPLPQTPVGPGGSRGISLPATPANQRGSIPLPATPGGPQGAGTAPPGVGIAPPATPGAAPRVGVPPPATPGGPPPSGGIAPPATPGGPSSSAGLPPPATPGGPPLSGGIAPPATPGGPQRSSVPMPATPAAIRGGVPMPATPAGLGSSRAKPDNLQPGDGPETISPVRSGARPAPATPAGLGGPPAVSSGNPGRPSRPAPQTPAFLGVSEPPEKKLRSSPRTPERALSGIAQAPTTPPQALAQHSKSSASSSAVVAGADGADAAPRTKVAKFTKPLTFANIASKSLTDRQPVVAAATAERSSIPSSSSASALSAGPAAAVAAPSRIGAAGPKTPLTFASVGAAGTATPHAAAAANGRPAESGGGLAGVAVVASSARSASTPLTFASVGKVAPNDKPGDHGLLPGWTLLTSKSNGKQYYWHAKLGKSQYERPVD